MLAPSDRKTFPSLVVASAATGICMADGMNISKFHEVYEHVLGHPVWTHELPSYGEAVRSRLAEQFPEMPSREAAEIDWKAAADAMTKAYGAEVSVLAGIGQRTRSPIETLEELVGPEKMLVVQT